MRRNFSKMGIVRTLFLLLLLATLCVLIVVSLDARTSGKPSSGRTMIPTSETAGPVAQGFVKVCGVHLCIDGKQWEPYFASTYDASHHLQWDIDTAAQGHLNTLRITNFLDENGNPQTAPYNEAHWRIVDQLIVGARAKGLHIILDLSTYRNMTTQDETHNPYLVDWKPFLTFVINRVNTFTNVRYGDDPTIAMFALAGEVNPPNGTNPLHETTQQIDAFFTRTAREFKTLDHNHLLSPGGLYQFSWNSGVDYKTVFSNPDLDICAVHSPPTGPDAAITARYCASIHKPWLWEEFFDPQGVGDQARAQFFQQTYHIEKQLDAAGIGFWNLGPGLGTDNDDVGPQTPLTWQVIVKNAPPAS